MFMLEKNIRYLKGVGEQRAKLFQKRGIQTVRDMLYYFPRGHEDRSKIKYINDCVVGETVCVCATVFSAVRDSRIRSNFSIQTLNVSDDSGGMQMVWYNNKYIKNTFKSGDTYVFFGKIIMSGNKKQMLNPVFEKYGAEKYTGKIVPLYPLTEGLTQKIVQSTIAEALKSVNELTEYIPSHIRTKYNIARIDYAMKNIHFPDGMESYSNAKRRFVFEELLIYSLALASKKKAKTESEFSIDISYADEFYDILPFEMTNAQKRVVSDICTDFTSGFSMNRLVQGDVGSGKTAVAAAAIYTVVKSGYQSCMMAPTEILARQHYETFCGYFDKLGVNTILLTSSMKAAEKREAYAKISNGDADIVIGTHAVIQKNVEFARLGLVIADEQHRFGVGQRSALMAKGENPHMLVMSATPIPRTLALILYGDLDVSVIDELPPGRKPVKTYAVGESMRSRAYGFLKKQIDAGFQGYIVCPLVEETEKNDLKNAVDLSEKIQKQFPMYNIGLVHGRMKAAEKDDIMSRFEKGEIHILVSTTVIEVGVNVPNSNIMIVENAERFGLSQLHQLRGRVGRGSDLAYCVLIAHGSGELIQKRMKTMCESNDGFYISEQDLKLRGPGDFFGTRQHGLPEMKIANLFEDTDILKPAQQAATEILSDTDGDYGLLKERIKSVFTDEIIMN